MAQQEQEVAVYTAARPRRILVVDDHAVLTELVADAIDGQPDLQCVGTAADVPAALTVAAATRPDTVLLDVQLPSGDGIALLAQLREALPGVRVVLLTGHPRPDRERVALEAGAVGYLGKDSRLAEIIGALRSASATRPARDGRLLERARVASSTRGLSPREQEVLGLLAQGRHVTDIARVLGVSTFTVRDHVKALLGKLDARSQLEAVAVAAREGLVRLGAP